MAIQPRVRRNLHARRGHGSRAGRGVASPPFRLVDDRARPYAEAPAALETQAAGQSGAAAPHDLELERELDQIVRAVDFVASGATRWVMLAGLRRAGDAIDPACEIAAGRIGAVVTLRLDSPTSILVRRDGD
jgi:hypothetical protein